MDGIGRLRPDRQAPRCFRLSRIVGTVTLGRTGDAFTVPPDVDLISHVARTVEPTPHGTATVLLWPGRADGVRRRAEQVASTADGDVATVTYHDVDGFADWLVSYGADVGPRPARSPRRGGPAAGEIVNVAGGVR